MILANRWDEDDTEEKGGEGESGEKDEDVETGGKDDVEGKGGDGDGSIKLKNLTNKLVGVGGKLIKLMDTSGEETGLNPSLFFKASLSMFRSRGF